MNNLINKINNLLSLQASKCLQIFLWPHRVHLIPLFRTTQNCPPNTFFIKCKFWSEKNHILMISSPLPAKGCKFLPNALDLWPLSSESSLACHTHCDTGHPFIMVFCEDPWHSQLLLSISEQSLYYLFYPLRSVAAGIRTPNLPLARRMLYLTAPPQPQSAM